MKEIISATPYRSTGTNATSSTASFRLYRDLIRLRLNRDGFTRGLCGQFTQVYHLAHERKLLAYQRWDQGGAADDVVVRRQLSERAAGRLRHRLSVRGDLEAPLQQRLAGLQCRFRKPLSGDWSPNRASRTAFLFHGSLYIGPYSVLIFSQ